MTNIVLEGAIGISDALMSRDLKLDTYMGIVHRINIKTKNSNKGREQRNTCEASQSREAKKAPHGLVVYCCGSEV
jgi:hypothetical protein